MCVCIMKTRCQGAAPLRPPAAAPASRHAGGAYAAGVARGRADRAPNCRGRRVAARAAEAWYGPWTWLRRRRTQRTCDKASAAMFPLWPFVHETPREIWCALVLTKTCALDYGHAPCLVATTARPARARDPAPTRTRHPSSFHFLFDASRRRCLERDHRTGSGSS